MKKSFKILLFFSFFGLFIQNIFAFDAKINIGKNKTDINDYINLTIGINSNEGGEIGITNIKGLENFEVINQSQSQSSSTSMVVTNGKTESKTKTIHKLLLTLKAKEKGDFIIGPAILQKGNEKIETNTVKISVSGDNLFINNNHLNTTTTNSVLNKNNNSNNISNSEPENSIVDYEKIDKVEFKNNNEIYLLFGILLIAGLGLYFYMKNNPDLVDKLINDKNNKFSNKKDDNLNNKDNDNGIISDESENIDFESKNLTYDYPEVSSEQFLQEINKIFNSKVSVKYMIKNIDNLSGDQILKLADSDDKKNISEIIDILNKAKYSNIISNKSRILDLIKDL